MPEISDVESFRRYLESTSLHKIVDRARVHMPELLVEGTSEDAVVDALEGHRLASTRRHGKNLFVHLDGGDWLHLHFGMTGFFDYREDQETPEYTALEIDFEDGSQLAFISKRKLGKIGLLSSVDEYLEEKGLGPDPLAEDFDRDVFLRVVGQRRGSLKGTLMNQEVLAGLGNELVDEILFQAELHPKIKIPDLDENDLEHLYDVTMEVVGTVTEARIRNRDLPDSYILPRREEGAECPRCGGPLERIEVSGRAGYHCPDCQEAP